MHHRDGNPPHAQDPVWRQPHQHQQRTKIPIETGEGGGEETQPDVSQARRRARTPQARVMRDDMKREVMQQQQQKQQNDQKRDEELRNPIKDRAVCDPAYVHTHMHAAADPRTTVGSKNWVSTHTHTRTSYTHTHVHIHNPESHTHTRPHTRTHTCTHTHTHLHAHTHTRTHTNTHAHTNTLRNTRTNTFTTNLSFFVKIS